MTSRGIEVVGLGGLLGVAEVPAENASVDDLRLAIEILAGTPQPAQVLLDGERELGSGPLPLTLPSVTLVVQAGARPLRGYTGARWITTDVRTRWFAGRKVCKRSLFETQPGVPFDVSQLLERLVYSLPADQDRAFAADFEETGMHTTSAELDLLTWQGWDCLQEDGGLRDICTEHLVEDERACLCHYPAWARVELSFPGGMDHGEDDSSEEGVSSPPRLCPAGTRPLS